MKDVRRYELFGGIALKNHAFFITLIHLSAIVVARNDKNHIFMLYRKTGGAYKISRPYEKQWQFDHHNPVANLTTTVQCPA